MFGIGKKAEEAVAKSESKFAGIGKKVGGIWGLAKKALMLTGAVSIYKSLTKDKAAEYVEKNKVYNAENNVNGVQANPFDKSASNTSGRGYESDLPQEGNSAGKTTEMENEGC